MAVGGDAVGSYGGIGAPPPVPPAALRLQGGGLVVQDRPDFIQCPNKELSLFAFAGIVPDTEWSGVGVLRGVETARRVGHLAHNVIQYLFGNSAQNLVACHLPGADAPRTRASCGLS